MLHACSLAITALGLLAETGRVDFAAGAEEAAVPPLFRLEAGSFEYELRPIRDLPECRVSLLRFPSPAPSGDPANDRVHADFFEPKAAGRRPAVVVLHILGADFALSRYMALRLADRGVAALFVRLPYYGERRAAGSGRRFLSGDLDASMGAMRQGICDVRRALTWLASRPGVDPGRLGVAGISLGGIVSAVVAGSDPRVDRAALLLAGGGLDSILWDMPEPEARRYRAAWLAAGRTRDELAAVTRPFDPLTYAEGLRGKRVLMIAGRIDEVVPPSAAAALWEAAGRPEIDWHDCGHYSAAALLVPAIERTADFLAAE